jgi:hypothetical protein
MFVVCNFKYYTIIIIIIINSFLEGIIPKLLYVVLGGHNLNISQCKVTGNC